VGDEPESVGLESVVDERADDDDRRSAVMFQVAVAEEPGIIPRSSRRRRSRPRADDGEVFFARVGPIMSFTSRRSNRRRSRRTCGARASRPGYDSS